MSEDRDFDYLDDTGPSGRPARPMREARVRMTEIVMPNDTNPHGNISGGRVAGGLSEHFPPLQQGLSWENSPLSTS